MEAAENSTFLKNLIKEFSLKLTDSLLSRKIYSEIEKFKDFEYVYCIAYEMLIRTDEYNFLLEQYDVLMDSADILENEKIKKIDEFVLQMNKLGLSKNSFIGFDCGDGNVFEKIKLYSEINNSPWSVRTLDKFILDTTSDFENILYYLIVHYHKKEKLYIAEDSKAENMTYIKTKIDPINALINHNSLFIPCIDKASKQIFYKSLSDTIYLKELDEEFLSTLKEKKEKNLLKQIKLDYEVTNHFWYKYDLDDIKNGLSMLITYYLNNNRIFQNNKQINPEFSEVFYNPSQFYIPCVNRSSKIQKTSIMQITKNMPLKILEDDFLSKLEFADLKNGYIETVPIFARPRLLFDEARLINLPINLNLSKEELLFYISQVKDDYDKNKDIVKGEIEYIFNLVLESDTSEIPRYIKHVKTGTSNTKRLLPSERQKFKKSLASAFYIYDLYKFFFPYFEKKICMEEKDRDSKISNIKSNYRYDKNSTNRSDEIKEIKDIAEKNLKNYNIITQIYYLLGDLSEEQVKYYLDVMKEFIHGVNPEDEKYQFKKKYDSKKFVRPEPKYKDLIIGDSYILKSNNVDLIKNLFSNSY